MTLALALAALLAAGTSKPPMTAPSLYDVEVKTIDGKPTTLAEYKGKALLIVNTASECGFTPQYEGLEKLHEKYRARGFTVLAFPSNDFGGQEPGSEAEIKKFCALRFKTTFPLFAKVKVKGEGKHALYQQLISQQAGEVKWNFAKFLVDPQGKVVARFDSGVKPDDEALVAKVEAALPK